ncbi:MAG TPA: hypothetical protein VI456_16700 [Polyangia bacterium]
MAAYLTIPWERRLAVVFALALVVVSCGGGGEAGSTGGKAGAGGAGGGSAPLCIPGASVSCACPNGATGAQICNASGSGYGTCSCIGSGAAGAVGSAGVVGTDGGAGAGGSATAGSGGSSGGHAGAGGQGGAGGGSLPITPLTGSHTCTDFDSSSNCSSYSPSNNGNFNNSASGSTSIVYPLDHSLFPSNLGPIQIQMSTSGTAARINLQTTQSSNVNVSYFGACEAGFGSGCTVTLPVAFTRMLVPASQNEDIQITARVLNGTTPTNDSAAINAAWAAAALTGGLYYWTTLPNQQYCPSSTMATPGSYCLEDITQNPKNGTAIYRYDFSQANPTPQQIWTDDGGPSSNPSYQGSPQSWDNGQPGGHCIGCHSITNDGKFMGLTVGGSSTYNAANWELLDLQNQDLLNINPTRTGGNACSDSSASPTNDPTCYWEAYRKDAFATETAWAPSGNKMVSMYLSKLFLNSVTPNGASATISQTGLALPSSALALDPYQSDPFWSHDGRSLVYTSFNTAPTASSTGNPGGLNGDLKVGGRIAIADVNPSSETIMDDARVLVARQANITSYYPCVSEDGNWVVYDQSNCGGNPNATDINYNGSAGYGTGVCDGYDDSSAKLYLVSTDGNTQLSLTSANGGTTNYDNSWPRFSPSVASFRGQTLYWVAFSSRRPYGVQNNTGGLSTSQPQLWFSAITPSGVNAGDPSWAPVWLPGQNPAGNGSAYGNHTPQWVRVAAVIDQP